MSDGTIDETLDDAFEKWTLFPLTEDRKPAVKWGSLPAGHQDMSGAGTGIATGSRSGVFVLDCDDLDAELPGDVPDTFTVSTRRGVHFYFRVPEGVRIPTTTSFPVRGWDIRGEGGFAVLYADGYSIADESPPAEPPEWLLQCIAEYELQRLQRPSGRAAFSVDLSTPLGRKMLRQAEAEVKDLEVGGAGERDLRLFQAANHLVRVRGLPVDAACELLEKFYRPRVAAEARDTTVSPDRIRYKCEEALVEGVGDFFPLDDEDIRAAIERNQTHRAIENNAPVNITLSATDMVQAPELRKAKGISELVSIFAQHPEWSGALKYNAFADRHEVVNPPVSMISKDNSITDTGITSARVWLEAVPRGIIAGQQAVFDALLCVSHANQYHPLQDYLRTLPECEDPEGVIQDLAVEGLGITDSFEVELLRKFLLGAVSRAMRPGCKFDGVLVLHGVQNLGKSKFLYALSPNSDWVQEDLSDLEAKDSREELRGRWLVEVAEFQAAMRKHPAIVKSFFTRQEDSYRRSYARASERFPRQCVFIATTNDGQFLRDATGDRRYWVIHPSRIDLAWVERNRDRIWSAMFAMYESGQNTWLTSTQLEELAQRQEVHKTAQALLEADIPNPEDLDPWTDLLDAAPKGAKGTIKDIYLKWIKGGIAMVNDTIAHSAVAELSMKDFHRLGRCLRRAGWTVNKKGTRFWTKV